MRILLRRFRSDRGRTMNAPSGITVRATAGEPVIFRVRVFEEGDRYSPMRVDDTSDLLEVRSAAGEGAVVRFAEMEQISDVVYETTYRFPESGDYVAEVLPGLEDRSRLPSDSADQVLFSVESAPTPASDGSSAPAIMATLALIVLVGLLVVRITRGRAHSTKEPITHDTWWNSP